MAKFKQLKLDTKYEKEIQEWFVYLDQKKFGLKLQKKMLKEINAFMETKESLDKLMERVFEKPELEIEFLNDSEVFVKSTIDFMARRFVYA